MVDLRLVCENCGMKWFVAHDRPQPEQPVECASCGGQLRPLAPLADSGPAGWEANPA